MSIKHQLTKLLSYLIPITVEEIPSEQSGVIELTWHNGRKILDTANTNYSYGSLQEILRFALNKIDLNHVNSILLLGLGGGSVIQSLREEFDYQNSIVAVELDSVMIRLAKEEFDIQASSKLEIVEADAVDFIKERDHLFDLIIVDIFIDNIVPETFYSIGFWEHVTTSLHPGCAFIFNAGFTDNNGTESNRLIEFLEQHYSLQKFEHVVTTNDVLIGRRGMTK